MKPTIKFALVTGVLVALTLAVWYLRERSTPSSGQTLTVPAGFEVERVAGPPLVDRPIVADFDNEGRLYVADSSGSNDKVQKQLAERPHRIVRLEDKNGDGHFDTSIVFADKMMFPEGTLWFDGSLYVAAPPSIWKLTDTNGDGVADQREEWFQGKTLTNCANDLHGPYLGPDGWIYWAKGAFAQQTYQRPGKPPLVTRASHIFRRHPGDSLVESVMTGGMDNPVDVAFTPSGERILTATFLEHPQLGRRDALVHAIYGGLYGKPHYVLDGHKKTGELMPELTHYGAAAPCGLTHYASRVFGDEYRDNFFACLFNMHKVTRHALEPSGATFKSRDSDFLVSDSLDFHPTDVLEDADGSLLVIDTGAWYKLCCPTSQLAKPEVLGAIYRVRRKGATRLDDPRGLKLAWDKMSPADLVKQLDDARPAIRNRTLYQLGKLGSDSVSSLYEVLTSSTSIEARRNAVWALTRIESAQAREAVRRALKDPDESVRQAAIHSAAVLRDVGALPQLVEALKSNSPHLQRAAAEALGRLGDQRAVPDLLATAASQLDRTLEHSVTYALIEIADPPATASGLQAISPRTKRAALIALDQMDGGGLKPETVTPLLGSSDPVLRETAWWITGQHKDWGGALTRYFQARLADPDLSVADREDLQQRFAQFGENPAIQELLSATVDRAASRDARLTALRAMAKTRLKALPAIWTASLVRVLGGNDREVTRHAVSVARAVPVSKEAAADMKSALIRIARDTSTAADVRLDALAAIHDGLTQVGPEEFELLRSGLGPAQPSALRATAAGVLEKSKLSREQLLMLADCLQSAGPLELPRLLPAFDNAGDETLGLAMIAALKESKGRSNLRPDMLRPRLAKYPESVKKQGEDLLASLHVDAAKQTERLEGLLVALKGGDIRRGQLVFNGQKAACLSCHAIGYLGGKVGPDLTRIGQIRSERDLLEAIIYPDVSFVRSYEPMLVVTKSGGMHSGVLRSDLPDEVVLATNATEEARIARQEIAEMRPGTVSVMPSGLDEQLTQQELADLLAFLKATKRGAN